MLKPNLMLLPGSFPTALILLLLCVICWGSWTNSYRLARKWPLELYQFDWAIGVILTSVLAVATAGMLFGRPNLLDDLHVASTGSLLCCLIAGVTLNLGNFLLMAGIVRVGMTIAFPIAVGFSLVAGTLLSYWIRPLGNPVLLAAGVAVVLCAVVTNSFAHRSAGPAKAAAPRGGIAMCFASGILFSVTGALIAKALAPPLAVAPYGAILFYAIGIFLTAPFLLLYLLRWPISGAPLAVRDYWSGSARNHASGILGGAVWGAGMILDLVAAGIAGMAVAGAIGQANPLIAAVWGIFVWKEFRGASSRTRFLLTLMLVLYTAGLVLLALSLEA
jgi:glucose uptake protein